MVERGTTAIMCLIMSVFSLKLSDEKDGALSLVHATRYSFNDFITHKEKILFPSMDCVRRTTSIVKISGFTMQSTRSFNYK